MFIVIGTPAFVIGCLVLYFFFGTKKETQNDLLKIFLGIFFILLSLFVGLLLVMGLFKDLPLIRYEHEEPGFQYFFNHFGWWMLLILIGSSLLYNKILTKFE